MPGRGWSRLAQGHAPRAWGSRRGWVEAGCVRSPRTRTGGARGVTSPARARLQSVPRPCAQPSPRSAPQPHLLRGFGHEVLEAEQHAQSDHAVHQGLHCKTNQPSGPLAMVSPWRRVVWHRRKGWRTRWHRRLGRLEQRARLQRHEKIGENRVQRPARDAHQALCSPHPHSPTQRYMDIYTHIHIHVTAPRPAVYQAARAHAARTRMSSIHLLTHLLSRSSTKMIPCEPVSSASFMSSAHADPQAHPPAPAIVSQRHGTRTSMHHRGRQWLLIEASSHRQFAKMG
jgi:hypothetical protein